MRAKMAAARRELRAEFDKIVCARRKTRPSGDATKYAGTRRRCVEIVYRGARILALRARAISLFYRLSLSPAPRKKPTSNAPPQRLFTFGERCDISSPRRAAAIPKRRPRYRPGDFKISIPRDDAIILIKRLSGAPQDALRCEFKPRATPTPPAPPATATTMFCL